MRFYNMSIVWNCITKALLFEILAKPSAKRKKRKQDLKEQISENTIHSVGRCDFIFESLQYLVQGSGMPNLRTKFEQSANVLKNPAFAAGLFHLSGIFNTKRLRSACAHDAYHWSKQLLPWIQMSRFSGDGL